MKASCINIYRWTRRVGKFTALVLTLLLVFLPAFITTPPKASAATTTVNLGNVANFAVMGAAAISDTTVSSTIIGDVGLWHNGGASITELTCNEVTGTIYDNDGHYTGNGGGIGCLLKDAGLLNTAHDSLKAAYLDAESRTPTITYDPIHDLGGETLTPGIYNDSSSFTITGILTLNGGGDTNAVFIFQAGSTLSAESGSKVVLTNGTQPCNVFWQVGSSATLNNSTFVGNILAETSISDAGGSTIDGRLLAGSDTDEAGAVTLHNTTVTKSTCSTPSPTSTSNSTSTSTSNSTSNGSSCSVCQILNSGIIAPTIIESRRVDADSIFISWGPYSGIDTFNVQYGFENGNWLYNTNVTGFSTTINALPPNQPIWARIAARNEWTIGTYGEAKLVGGPSLPNTGFAPYENNILWYLPTGIFLPQSLVPKNQLLCRASPELPVRLIIPAINIDADIQHLGVTPEGEMEVPSNIVDAGWFKLGPRPGEKGSAVIAGHFNGENGEAGVFANLYKLKEGDKLYVEDDKGTSIAFVVRESRTYDPGYADYVFSPNDSAHLNLVTCDGQWDRAKKSYSKRLVVFADITH